MGCRRCTNATCAIVLCVFALHKGASADTYDVVPEESYLTIAVLDHSSQYLLTSAQVSGSDSTTLGGSFDATIGGGYITFTTSGNILFDNQGSDMQPEIGGGSASAGTEPDPYPPSPGDDPANYGLFISVPLDPEHPEEGLALAGVLAIRDAVADLTSGSIPITLGAFDASLITLGLPDDTGTLDYNINQGDGTPFIFGSTGIGDNSGPNSATGGMISTFGLLTVIDIPIDVNVHVVSGDLDVDVILQGRILGVESNSLRGVPEPSTLAIAFCGLIGLLPVLRRRRPI